MKRMLRAMVFVGVLAVSLVYEGAGAVQNAKDKKGDAKVDPVELEKQLLMVPEKKEDRDAWLKAWQKNLILGFRAPVGRGIDRSMQAVTVDNKTPCTLSLQFPETLYKDGKKTKEKITKDANKTKDAPERERFEVEAGKKIYLGVQPRLATVTIKHDLKGAVISALNRGKFADMHVTPNHTPDMKAIDLAIMIEYGERGAALGPATWTLIKPEEVEDFFKRK